MLKEMQYHGHLQVGWVLKVHKSTPYAAQVAAEDAAKKAMEHGMKKQLK